MCGLWSRTSISYLIMTGIRGHFLEQAFHVRREARDSLQPRELLYIDSWWPLMDPLTWGRRIIAKATSQPSPKVMRACLLGCKVRRYLRSSSASQADRPCSRLPFRPLQGLSKQTFKTFLRSTRKSTKTSNKQKPPLNV